jgi:predicted RNA-binding protein with PUA-like domain
LKAGKKLKTPVTLAQVKADPKLANILLVKNGRISVMSLTKSEFDRIVKLGS